MVSSARQLLLSPSCDFVSPVFSFQSGDDMKGQNNSRSLPHLSVISASGEEADLSESLLSPLTPQLAPTFRAQNLSPFWLSSAVELPQLPGYTSASQGQAGLYSVYSLHLPQCWLLGQDKEF